MTSLSRLARTMALAACFGALAAALPARAEAGPPVADPALEAAKKFFEQANRAYDKAQFEEALKLYGKAFDLKPHAAFLFNMGQCEKYLGHWQKAEFLYSRYLASLDPKAKDRKLAQDLIDEMREKQRLAAASAQASPKPAASPPASPPDGGVAVAPTPPPVAPVAPPLVLTPSDSAVVKPPGDAPKPEPGTPLYKRWWLWTAVGAVVAGGAAAGLVIANPSTRYPDGTLAPIDAR